jgi:hypothetical protein
MSQNSIRRTLLVSNDKNNTEQFSSVQNTITGTKIEYLFFAISIFDIIKILKIFWFKFLRILKIRIKSCIFLINETYIYEFYREIKFYTANRNTSARSILPG